MGVQEDNLGKVYSRHVRHPRIAESSSANTLIKSKISSERHRTSGFILDFSSQPLLLTLGSLWRANLMAQSNGFYFSTRNPQVQNFEGGLKGQTKNGQARSSSEGHRRARFVWVRRMSLRIGSDTLVNGGLYFVPV